MNIRSVSEFPLIVRGRRCPRDCDENGSLAYLSCPECGKVALICDEIGNVFDNLDHPLSSLPLVAWRTVGQHCPACEKVRLADFVNATEADLLRAGRPRNEWERGDLLVLESITRVQQ